MGPMSSPGDFMDLSLQFSGLCYRSGLPFFLVGCFVYWDYRIDWQVENSAEILWESFLLSK